MKTIRKTRLEVLEEEKEIVKKLQCLSFNISESAIRYYNSEIAAIRLYNACNPIYEMEVEDDK